MGSLDGKLYMTNHTDQSKVEVLDLRREESGGGGGAAADALGAEPVLIMEHPHAPRYVGYMATTGAIKVWDVAKRCTVRSATFGASFSTLPDSSGRVHWVRWCNR